MPVPGWNYRPMGRWSGGKATIGHSVTAVPVMGVVSRAQDQVVLGSGSRLHQDPSLSLALPDVDRGRG